MKKKILLLISMLAVSFAFTGCGTEDELFEYDAQEAAEFCVTADTEFISIAENELQYNYLVDVGTSVSGITEEYVDAVEVFHTSKENYGAFVSFGNTYEIEEFDDSIVVSIDAEYENADVVIKTTVVDNSAQYEYALNLYMESYGYTEDEAAELLASSGIYPYAVSECEISEDLSMGALLKSAGTNTIIGMVTVFIVLIFIAFIISLLKYAPKLVDSVTKAREEKKANKADAEEPVTERMAPESKPAGDTVTREIVSITDAGTGENVMDNGELVAVISAAVDAYMTETPVQPAYVNYPSNDKLIVRSLRRR